MNYTPSEIPTRLLQNQVKDLEASLRFCLRADRPFVRATIKEYKDELEKRAALEATKEGA